MSTPIEAQAPIHESENFAITLTDKCKTHSEWLSVVRYGLASLLQNQPLLIEIIVREAVREIERVQAPSHVGADEPRPIFKN